MRRRGELEREMVRRGIDSEAGREIVRRRGGRQQGEGEKW